VPQALQTVWMLAAFLVIVSGYSLAPRNVLVASLFGLVAFLYTQSVKPDQAPLALVGAAFLGWVGARTSFGYGWAILAIHTTIGAGFVWAVLNSRLNRVFIALSFAAGLLILVQLVGLAVCFSAGICGPPAVFLDSAARLLLLSALGLLALLRVRG